MPRSERRWVVVAVTLLALATVATMLGFVQGNPLWFPASALLAVAAGCIAFLLDHA